MANSITALSFVSSSPSIIPSHTCLPIGDPSWRQRKSLSKSHPRLRCLVGSTRNCSPIKATMMIEKPLEELYNVRVERGVSAERLEELGVARWSVWKTGKCQLPWDWHVDQLVYIEEGEIRVVPEGSHRYMRFVAGDLVRYPKWFEADLFFNAPYQERYSFRAYGDDS